MPGAAALQQFYEDDYRLSYKGSRHPTPRRIARAGRLALSRLQGLSKFVQPGHRLLDVGSASGEWLYVLKRHGVIATGVELDRGYAEFARTEYRVDTLGTTLNEMQLSEKFDVVTLFHVLEHLPDPLVALRKSLSCLSDRGLLIVETPNMASPHQHPRKRFHTAHVLGFTPQTLARAVRDAGGDIIEIQVSSFSRNVIAIAAKGPSLAETTKTISATDMVVAVRPSPLWAYYGSPVTYYRFVQRAAALVLELIAASGKTHPRQILDALILQDSRLSGARTS